jgi:hypothetical protein
MTIKTRVEKLEAADPAARPLRNVVMLFDGDPEPEPEDESTAPEGRGPTFYIRIIGVEPSKELAERA